MCIIYIYTYYIYIFFILIYLVPRKNCQAVFPVFHFHFSASEKLKKWKRTGQFFTGFLNHGALEKTGKKLGGEGGGLAKHW